MEHIDDDDNGPCRATGHIDYYTLSKSLESLPSLSLEEAPAAAQHLLERCKEARIGTRLVRDQQGRFFVITESIYLF